MIVQKLRLQRGWTQEQLAIVSGLSTRTIQRIERGQEPSPESLKALAAVFDVDFQTLKEPQMEREMTRAGSTMAEEALAFEHVRSLKGLYYNLLGFCIVIPVLVAINYFYTQRQIWVVFPIAFWSIGLLFKAARLFNWIPFWGGNWEKRQVEKYLGRNL